MPPAGRARPVEPRRTRGEGYGVGPPRQALEPHAKLGGGMTTFPMAPSLPHDSTIRASAAHGLDCFLGPPLAGATSHNIPLPSPSPDSGEGQRSSLPVAVRGQSNPGPRGERDMKRGRPVKHWNPTQSWAVA